MTKTITATQARKDFFKLLKQAKTPGHFVRISLQGADDDVIMMSADEWDGWMETLEIMSDPALVKELRKADKEMKAGTVKMIPWEKVKSDLAL